MAIEERSNAFTQTVPPRSAFDMRCATFMFDPVAINKAFFNVNAILAGIYLAAVIGDVAVR